MYYGTTGPNDFYLNTYNVFEVLYRYS